MRSSFDKNLKKGGLFFFIVMIVLASTSTVLAQVQQEKRHAPPMETLPQEQNQLAVSYEDEIKKDELPEAVISSIKENYSHYKISEAYRGSDGSFKVTLEQEEKKIAAYYDASGEFLRIEKDEVEESINDDWR